MNNLLGSTDWSLLQYSDSINDKYDNLYSICYSHFDGVFPIVSKRIKKVDVVKPYNTKELKDLIAERRKTLNGLLLTIAFIKHLITILIGV